MTTRNLRSSAAGFEAILIHGDGPERATAEAEIDAAGLPLPLFHRTEWGWTDPSVTNRFVVVRNAAGHCAGGFAIESTHSRALPGHKVLRVVRLGSSIVPGATEASIDLIEGAARRLPMVLRVHLEVFSRDQAVRERIERLAEVRGFQTCREPRMYTRTLALGLEPEPSELFASFRKSTRRNITEIARRSMRLAAIEEEAYSARMNELLQKTMARTGSVAAVADWSRRIDLSRRYPARSRVVGVFLPGVAPPEDLVAFAWGRSHGDHVEYAESASMRIANASLTHALVWDLICWARVMGANWFDFGGITHGHAGSDDPLGGISDFKRSFGGVEIQVAREWVLEPNRIRGRLARAIGAATALSSRLTGKS